MIINDESAAQRLASPMNLINRLAAAKNDSKSNRNSAMSLFCGPKLIDKKQEIVQEVQEIELKRSFNPFSKQEPPLELPLLETQEPTLDKILDNHDSQIRLGLAHDKALELLNASVSMLALKLEDVKADRLPSVISAAAKTVEGIRKERNEAAKNNKDREVHFHFYTPQQKTISDYEVIDVA